MTSGLVLLAYWSVQFSSVTSLCTRLEVLLLQYNEAKY